MSIDRNVFIHVGLHKCASTFLQNNVFDAHPGVTHISQRSPSGVSSTEMYREVTTYMNAMGGEFSVHGSKKSINNIIKNISRDQSIVISDEMLSGDLLTGRNCQAKAEKLDQIFRSPKILLLLREQKSYLLSAWKEYVSSGGVLSLQRFLFNWRSSPAYASRFYSIFNKVQYHVYVKQLYNIFGESNVYVRFIEDLKYDPQSFVNEVQKIMGVKLADLDLKKENVGIGFAAANILRLVNSTCNSIYNPSAIHLLPYWVQSKASNILAKIDMSSNVINANMDSLVKSEIEILGKNGISKKSVSKLISESNRELDGLVNKNISSLGFLV